MATKDDEKRPIPSLAPANGGRAPGGPFDPNTTRELSARADAANARSAPTTPIPSLAPPNGGRAPGGPFDPASFDRPAPAAPDRIMAAGSDPRPAGYDVGAAVVPALGAAGRAVNRGAGVVNRAVGAVGDAAVSAYGAADNVVRGVIGAEPAPYSPTAVTDALAGAGAIGARPAPTTNPVTPAAIAGALPSKPALPQTPQAGQPAVPQPGAPAPAPGVTQLPPMTVTPGTAANAPVVPPAIGMQPTRVPGITEVLGNPNGSRTFTNMPDATMANLAVGGDLTGRGPSAAPSAEGAAYLNTVPELGSGPTSRPSPTVSRSAPSGPSAGLAARFAQSDAAAIANEDTRSVAGNAARNARMTAQYSGGSRPSERAASQRAYEGTLAGLRAPGIAQAEAAAEAERGAAADDSATERAQIQAATELERANIESRPKPQTMTLADGSLSSVEGTNARPVVDAAGKQVKTAPAKAPQDGAAYAKIFQQNLETLKASLGIDPLTGMRADAEGNPMPLTAADVYQMNEQARELTQRAMSPNAQQGAVAEGEIAVDAAGNRARLVNGEYVPVE